MAGGMSVIFFSAMNLKFRCHRDFTGADWLAWLRLVLNFKPQAIEGEKLEFEY